MTTSPRPDPPPHRERSLLLERLGQEEARLRALEDERRRVVERIASLKAELPSTRAMRQGYLPLPILGTAAVPRTPLEKVALFRSLFRGRGDVYPTLWTNSRTGKKGYAPACGNEWVPGVCEKPQVKCGECPHQAFLPVTDQVVRDHLEGKHVIGVYPLLEDETCWFLAADFDKTSWTEDAAAFVEASRENGVPAAVERSRSGNGAHVWFFFEAPVRASVARRLGCFLLTAAMSKRPELGMASYDRLFPNQDTMPRGGFGNLIALPLQHGPRKMQNTVFLDESFRPREEQWAYLASVPRIPPAQVESIAGEAAREGRVIGLRRPAAQEEDDGDVGSPWSRPPSRKSRRPRIAGPVPAEVHAVLAQRLFVAKEGLPPALLSEIQRLAAFQNPEFYKKQNLRLSTALTPRVISCAEDLPRHVALPRGCRGDLEALLRDHESRLVVEDQREEGEPLELRFHGELTSVQVEASRALLEHDTGVFVAPPGVGKTVLGIHLIARRARSTLILVHRRQILDQWTAQLSLFLGLDPRKIGELSGTKRKVTGRLDVAMIQSVARAWKVDDVVAAYGHVVVDECHHVPAVTVERVLSEVKARCLLGLTATPERRDGRHPILEMQLGPARYTVDPRSVAAARPFEQRLVVRETGFRLEGGETDLSIQAVYAALARSGDRNRLILDDVIGAVDGGKSPLVLTERKDHLEYLAGELRKAVRHVVVFKGGMTGKARREAAEALARIPAGEERLILATGRYIGEGFDDARLDALFLTMPIAWKGTLIQYAGRLQRLRPGKSQVWIFDYLDREVPMLRRMFEKRLRTYKALGYEGDGGLPGQESKTEEA